MKKLLLSGILCLPGVCAPAQQIAKAGSVQLVTSANTQVVATGGITFTGTASFTHNGQLSILSNPVNGAADWLDSTAAGVISSASSGHILFKGTMAVQQVYGRTAFDSITVQNTGLSLQQSNEVRQCLNLNAGLLYISNSADSIYISNPAIGAVVYNTVPLSSTSWVHGKLSRKTNSSSGTYVFPVGKILGADSLYAPVYIDKVNSNAATYSTRYFPAEPVDRFNHSLLIHHISGLEYWDITSHNYAAPADDDAALTLSWRKYSTVSTSAAVRDSLLIAHYYNDGSSFSWRPELNFGAAGIVSGDEYFGFIKSNVTIGDFSMPHLNFTIGSRSAFSLLPENNLLLSAVMNECRTQLSFSRSFSADVYRFDAEWSANGIQWQKISSVMAGADTGLLQTYTAVHANPVAGINYYRVKQVMRNGAHIYSVIKRVSSNCGGAAVNVYPNPFTNHIIVNGISNGAAVQLINADGKTVITTLRAGNPVQINTGNLPAGRYVLLIAGTDGGRQSFKLVK